MAHRFFYEPGMGAVTRQQLRLRLGYLPELVRLHDHEVTQPAMYRVTDAQEGDAEYANQHRGHQRRSQSKGQAPRPR
jgi:hypothetical protein